VWLRKRGEKVGSGKGRKKALWWGFRVWSVGMEPWTIRPSEMSKCNMLIPYHHLSLQKHINQTDMKREQPTLDYVCYADR
jgi:hypothetical protein